MKFKLRFPVSAI
jgi:uncharacterized protein (UPF0297 family)